MTSPNKLLNGLFFTFAICAAAPAFAQANADQSYQIAQQQTYADVLVSLESIGYRVLKMETTFLGRMKILAQNREHVREVVVSRSTGEIMSDRVVRVFARPDSGAKRQAAIDEKAKGSSPSTTPSLQGVIGTATPSGDPGGASASAGGASVSVGGGGLSIAN